MSPMDRETIIRHLADAEEHVAQGVRHIVEQEARIKELNRDGHDTTEARRLLTLFVETQVQHVEHRDRLLGDLAQF